MIYNLEDRCIDDVVNFIYKFWFLYYLKQVDFMLPCICSVVEHRKHQNVVRTSVTHLMAYVPLFGPYYDFVLMPSVMYY